MKKCDADYEILDASCQIGGRAIVIRYCECKS